jgi:uncharacterized membrane protein required for colicin V production
LTYFFNKFLAFTLSYALTPFAAELIEKYSQNALVSDIAARSLIFVLVFFVCAISTSGLRDALKEKIPNIGLKIIFVKLLHRSTHES